MNLKTRRIPRGAAVWQADQYLLGKNGKHVASFTGVLEADQFADGLDIDEFVEKVWSTIKGDGLLGVTLTLLSEVVEITAYRDSDGVECESVSTRGQEPPAFLCGRWAA